jgi:ABC-type branched-subunit amino acid transport system substrate-binding protein
MVASSVERGGGPRRRLLLSGTAAALGVAWAGLARAQAPVLKLGQSASLTGGQAAYGQDVRDGLLAALAAANRNDTKAPPLELVTLDDGGDKERCKANVLQLIDAGALALVGLTSGAGAEHCLPVVEAQKVVLLGTASGNMGIRGDKLSMPFHVRPGYDIEYARLVDYVKSFHMRRVGLVMLKDTSAANRLALDGALQRAGVQPTVLVALDRNQKAFQAEVQQLLAAKLDCVLFSTNAGPITAIVPGMAAAGYLGFYFASSFAGQTLIDQLTDKGHAVIMSQVVPRPNAVATALVKRYRQDLAALNPALRPGFTSLEGYIAGRVAAEAARASARQGGATRARLREVLTAMDLDLGGYRMHFTPSSALGSRFVDVVAIDRTGRVIG